MNAADVVALGLQAAESQALQDGAIPGYSLMADGVLSALKQARWALVKLPDAHEDEPDVKHPYWVGERPGVFVAYAQAGGVWLETDAKYHALTVSDARACAAALLAAAARIEGVR